MYWIVFVEFNGNMPSMEFSDRPEMMRSIVRFEIKFRRVISYYFLSIALPLFCIATYVSGFRSKCISLTVFKILQMFVDYAVINEINIP